MNKLLPREYKKNKFNRFLNIIKNILLKRNNTGANRNIEELITRHEKSELQNLKVDTKINNVEYKQKEFIKQLENNPESLENFSIDRLEKILEYVLEDNKKKKNLLESLKS